MRILIYSKDQKIKIKIEPSDFTIETVDVVASRITDKMKESALLKDDRGANGSMGIEEFKEKNSSIFNVYPRFELVSMDAIEILYLRQEGILDNSYYQKGYEFALSQIPKNYYFFRNGILVKVWKKEDPPPPVKE